MYIQKEVVRYERITILVFADSDCEAINGSLLGAIRARSSCACIELVSHIESLQKRLRRLPKGIDIAILLVKDQEQLDELISLKEFFDGISIILILPDMEKKTISHATKLYPNFISSVDSGLDMVSDVLGNMLNLREKRFSLKEPETLTTIVKRGV